MQKQIRELSRQLSDERAQAIKNRENQEKELQRHEKLFSQSQSRTYDLNKQLEEERLEKKRKRKDRKKGKPFT